MKRIDDILSNKNLILEDMVISITELNPKINVDEFEYIKKVNKNVYFYFHKSLVSILAGDGVDFAIDDILSDDTVIPKCFMLKRAIVWKNNDLFFSLLEKVKEKIGRDLYPIEYADLHTSASTSGNEEVENYILGLNINLCHSYVGPMAYYITTNNLEKVKKYHKLGGNINVHNLLTNSDILNSDVGKYLIKSGADLSVLKNVRLRLDAVLQKLNIRKIENFV